MLFVVAADKYIIRVVKCYQMTFFSVAWFIRESLFHFYWRSYAKDVQVISSKIIVLKEKWIARNGITNLWFQLLFIIFFFLDDLKS